ncbi:uncharacterized protein [Ptychodera flava]|uniref:uncharacterized protein n=1 Tax=Ptychodera flava TaxID=63121 RepID=UPI003969E75F
MADSCTDDVVIDLDSDSSSETVDVCVISSDSDDDCGPARKMMHTLDHTSESSCDSDQSVECLDSSSGDESLQCTDQNLCESSQSEAAGRHLNSNPFAALESGCCEMDCLKTRLSKADLVVAQHLFGKTEQRRAQENRFTKCDVCVALKEEKAKTMDPELRTVIDKLMAEHNAVNVSERQTYFDHRELGRSPAR